MAGDEKTEKPTPKKRADTRKKGEVMQSKEVITCVSIVALFTTLSIFGKSILVHLMKFMENTLVGLGDEMVVNTEFLTNVTVRTLYLVAVCCLPLFLVAIVVSVIATIVQTKGLFNMSHLKPKFSKINPFTGIKRLFSLQAIVNVIKGLITVSIIGYVIYSQINSRIREISRMTDFEPMQGVLYIGKTVMSIVILVCVLFVFVAAADYIFQWFQFEKKLKMSKQEIKDEYKNIEGDPQIKAKIKQKQRQMAMTRMMKAVPEADVVIRNPTHYAVALKYDPHKHNAPVVVAKGVDFVAMRIVGIAEEHKVYITENPQLARALYDTVKVDREIPYELYTAIAEILSVVFNLKKRKRL